MLNNKYHTMKYKKYNQQGIALPLTLILLFAMTLLGIATLRTTTLEENMSANSRLRQVAFNAAESTLRSAEYSVLNLRRTGRRELFFSSGTTESTRPLTTAVSNGDRCLNGYCTPAQFNATNVPGGVAPLGERWEDQNLDVFNATNNPPTSIEFADYAGSNLAQNGVFEAPRYIVEFLGNYDFQEANVALGTNEFAKPKLSGAYVGACRDTQGNLTGDNAVWPYCAQDAGFFRITVRATAGPEARRATVTIQSILRVTGS